MSAVQSDSDDEAEEDEKGEVEAAAGRGRGGEGVVCVDHTTEASTNVAIVKGAACTLKLNTAPSHLKV